jgi:hypothetical protein
VVLLSRLFRIGTKGELLLVDTLVGGKSTLHLGYDGDGADHDGACGSVSIPCEGGGGNGCVFGDGGDHDRDCVRRLLQQQQGPATLQKRAVLREVFS